jgi:hypothetical protein
LYQYLDCLTNLPRPSVAAIEKLHEKRVWLERRGQRMEERTIEQAWQLRRDMARS